MDSLIQEVLQTARKYHIHKSGHASLIQQLEDFENVSSRSSYIRQLHTVDPVQLVDLLTFLSDVVRDQENQEVLQKAVKILLNLSHDENVRKLLHDNFSLCSPLASVVLAYSHGTEEQHLSDALQLMHRLTYGYRIDYHQPHIDLLLKFLVEHLISGEKTIIAPVLGTLANLCRNNLLVQSAIREKFSREWKQLLKTLFAYLSNENQMLVIFALSTFASLYLNETETQKTFFDEKNVEHTLQMIFSVVVNQFKTVTWKYAADLLSDLLRHPQMQIYIGKYRRLTRCIYETLALLSVAGEDSASDMFELLLNLCSVPAIRQVVNIRLFTPLAEGQVTSTAMSEITKKALTPSTEPLLCCLHWAAQPVNNRKSVACLALDFLIDSVQDTSLDKQTSHPVHLLCPVLASMLCEGDQDTAKVLKLVQLLTMLCSTKVGREALSGCLSVDVISKLVETQLVKERVSLSSSVLEQSAPTNDEGPHCVLSTLDLSWRLHKHISGIDTFIMKTLKDPRVMDILARGLTSSSQSQVEIVIKLLCIGQGVQDARPNVSFCSTVAHINKLKEQNCSTTTTAEPLRPVATSYIAMRSEPCVLTNKENHPLPLASSTPMSVSEDAKAEAMTELIEKMQGIMKPKDTNVSSLMEVLENQWKAQRISEEHLKNLLEAKNLALTQADRVIVEAKGRQASLLAEMKKLHGILKDSEKKNEHLTARMNDMRIETERMMSQYNQQLVKKEELIDAAEKAKGDLKEKCNELEEKLTGCKQEMKTLATMKDDLQRAHEILKEQYNTACSQSHQLEEERKLLSKQLKEKEASSQKLSASLQTLQSKFSDIEKERAELEKEKDDMEAYIDKLRNQLATSETSCRQLQQWNKSLEGCKQDLEDKVKEKTNRIEELEQEVEKHNQIISFINNMQLKGNKK